MGKCGRPWNFSHIQKYDSNSRERINCTWKHQALPRRSLWDYHIDNKEFLVKYKEKVDKIFHITGITHQQPSSVTNLLENDDSVKEISREANTGTSSNEPLDLKSGRKRKFEGSGTCIPEYSKPIENYKSTQGKQAKLFDFVLDSMEEVNMINEIIGKMYLHALSRQLFVEKHGHHPSHHPSAAILCDESTRKWRFSKRNIQRSKYRHVQ